MRLKDFVGKEVVCKSRGGRYLISRMNGVGIWAQSTVVNSCGAYSTYCWQTGTAPYSNAIADGRLEFVDASLTDAFIEVYENYSNTDGRMDQYLYCLRQYD